MIGKTVSHYEILEKLGEGGMGVVYKALDTVLNRHVAIKFLPSHLCADAQAKARFVHEARAASTLNHANIAVVHEIGETPDGQMFIVMALYEGKTLKDRLVAGALSVDETITIVTQLASGLSAAHEKGILHRDIKPANILMGEDGYAKIADFGLAKLSGQTRVTRTGTTVGTVSYMSPEQVTGGDIDHRSDIFSLGVVLYELLAGKLPFRGDHEAAVLYSIMNSDPTPLVECRAGLPPGLQAIVDKALSKSPDLRYQTAVEMRDELLALAKDAGAPGLTSRHRRGSPVRLTLWLSVVGIIIAGGVVGYQWFNRVESLEQVPADETRLVVAVAPFWGQNAEALEEGKVMQALVERRLAEVLQHDETVTVLGKKDVVEVPRSNEEAKALGRKLGATIVLWGEVLILRREVEIQPYLTYMKWFHYAEDLLPQGMGASLDDANQLGQRRGTAAELGNLVLRMAAGFYRAKDPDRALDLLRRVSPPTSESLVEQGSILMRAGRPGDAKEVFDRALERFPDEPRPYWGMGLYQSRVEGAAAAVAWFEKAIAVDSTFNDGYAGLSVSLVSLGRYDEAERLLKDATARFPRAYWVNVNMVSVFFAQRRYDEARHWAEKSIDVASNPAQLANSCTYMGHICRAVGENDEGKRWFERAVEADPEHWRPNLSLGDINFEEGAYEAAVEWYRRATQLNWDGAPIEFPVSYMMIGRYPEAAEALARLVELNPGDLHAALLYAICLHMAGRQQVARELIASRADTLTANDWITPVVRFYAGSIPAEEVIEAAESVDAELRSERICQANYYLGMAYLLGLPDGARPDTSAAMGYFEQCMATGEDSPESRHAGLMLESR